MPHATVGPSWSLRTGASPRCLSAYSVDRPSSSDAGAGAGGGAGVNPFDDDLPSPGGSVAGGVALRRCHAAALGTERGSLHHRIYPADANDMGQSSHDRHRNNGRRHGAGYGDSRGGAGTAIDPDGTCPDGQIDLQGAVKGSVVGIVRADPGGGVDDGFGGGGHSHSGGYDGGGVNPVFLLLVDDNRSRPPPGPGPDGSGPGAYGAHLVTVRNGSFQKLPPAPSGAASTLGGGGGESHRDFDQRVNAKLVNAASASGSQSAASLGPLPRMSCCAHRPETGYVYASGTSVRSLPPPAADAVLAGLVADGSSRSTGRRMSTVRQRWRAVVRSPAAVYANADRALPHPGVRPATGPGSAMALCCAGRVAVVAVSNSFYAVPAHLDLNAGSSMGVGEFPGSGGPSLSELAGGLPEVRAARVLSFAQSSQVHPVIALEVRGTGSGGDVARQVSAASCNVFGMRMFVVD